MTPSKQPMTTSVLRAFFHSGLRNAGTPFDTASTPVTAAPPEANACMTTYPTPNEANSAVVGCAPNGIMPAACGILWRCPTDSWYMPHTIRTPMLPMKKYVGTAKSLPDSFTPRRLPIAMFTTKNTEIGRIHGLNAGNADASAAVPAATDTETVNT